MAIFAQAMRLYQRTMSLKLSFATNLGCRPTRNSAHRPL